MLDILTIYERARLYTLELHDEVDNEQQIYIFENGKSSEVLEQFLKKFLDEVNELDNLIEIEVCKKCLETHKQKPGA